MRAGGLKLLDTDIFIHAQGGAHKSSKACRALVSSLAPDSSGYTMDTELLLEVIHAYILRGEGAGGSGPLTGLCRCFHSRYQ